MPTPEGKLTLEEYQELKKLGFKGFKNHAELTLLSSEAQKECQFNETAATYDEINGCSKKDETELNRCIYPGDQQDTSLPISKSGEWEKLDFESPAELICFFHPQIQSGEVTLHKWQKEVLEELSAAKPDSLHPYKFALCACNGSGKDAFVIAPFVIWFALCKIRSLSIITSSSGVQLTAQTEGYIKTLAQRVNEYFGEPYFKINQRFIKCLKSGSEIRLFATDEEGKAEGYHPLDPGREMAIIPNEAKSIAPEIFRALKRCTGFNYWINVSTPGEPFGDFYTSFTRWPHKKHVSTFECPHLSASEREDDKQEMGEHSPLYRSKHLALFTSLGGQVIIPTELVDNIIKRVFDKLIPLEYQSWPERIGGDLAAGGDEIVLTGVKGNRISRRIAFRQKDTMLTADLIEFHLLNTFKVPKTHEHLYFDDGGVGRGIIDNLRRRGWNIKRILNQSPAVKKQEFGNRGAEAWFRAKRILEEHLFQLDDDEKFRTQLSNRYYKQQSTQGRITLESKADARAHGRPSPDRADSFLLALTGLTIDDFLKPGETLEARKSRLDKEANPRVYDPERPLITNHNIHEYDTYTYKGFKDSASEKPTRLKTKRRSYGSIMATLRNN